MDEEGQPAEGERRCPRCGQPWADEVHPGRRSVVCVDCRPAYQREQAAARAQRYQQRQREAARRAAAEVAEQLAARHPEAVLLLANLEPRVAAELVRVLRQRREGEHR